MKTFYFTGGPTPSHEEAFFRRLGEKGGPPTGWRIYPHASGDRRALERVTWASLPVKAKAFRVAHVLAGVVNMTALGYVWLAALRRTRDVALAASVGLLSAEGLALVVGLGNCPFGAFQRSLGDPVPMFELFLPPRAAKAAIPLLAVVTVAGFAAVAIRRPGQRGYPAEPRHTTA